jgi:hypothetical protein
LKKFRRGSDLRDLSAFSVLVIASSFPFGQPTPHLELASPFGRAAFRGNQTFEIPIPGDTYDCLEAGANASVLSGNTDFTGKNSKRASCKIRNSPRYSITIGWNRASVDSKFTINR